MSDQQSNTYIPDGYVAIRGDNGQHYLVPHFMIPATHQAMEAYCKKVEFDVHMADGGVRFPFFLKCHSILAPMSACCPMQCLGRFGIGYPILAGPVYWPMPCLGRCRVSADAVSGLLPVFWLVYPSSH
jgi:hypothetical protein